MPESLKTAIIGPGKVGAVHAKALMNVKESVFSGAYGRNPEKTKAFADQFGVKAYATIEDMAADGIQAVLVCTPHPYHREAAVRAAKAGLHVLSEKPLASSLDDCDAMIQAAAESNVQLGTICQRRFYSPVQRVKNAIDSGRIGRPILGTVLMLGWRDEKYYRSDPWRGSWESEGGGVLVNQAPHQLDLLQWFMGPIDEVFGYWSNLNHPYIEVDDTAVALVKFRSGGIGNIVVSNSQNPALYGKVHVFGENGSAIGVQTDGGAMFVAGMSNILEPPLNDLWTIPGEEQLLDVWKKEDTGFFNSIDPVQYYMERQIENFLSSVLNGTKPLIDGVEGRKTVELFTAIYRSNRDHAPVRFPLAPEDSSDFDGRLK